MKKIILFVSFFILLSSFFLFSNSRTINEKKIVFIDSLLNAVYPANEPGISFLIAENGKTVFEKSYGMSDIESGVKSDPKNLYLIGSMTKQFTAVGILILINEKKINFDDNINKYLPEYNSQGRIITIENLLNHTSGIQGLTEKKEFEIIYRKKMNKDEIVNFFQNDSLVFEPGTDFSYNNSGYFLLALIIEKVSGVSYEEFIQKNIFDKLGMNNTYFGNSENNLPLLAKGYEPGGRDSYKTSSSFDWSWPLGAGNIISCTNDMLKWNNALLKNILIPESLLDKAWTSYKLKSGVNTNYGYGWNVTELKNSTIIKHGGGIGGYLCDGIYIPEKKIYFVALSNNGGKSPDAATNKIILKLLDIEDIDPPIISLDKNRFDEYTGSYQIFRQSVRLLKSITNEKQYRFILNDGDSLILTKTGGSDYGFFPYGKDKFFVKNSGKRFEFIRNDTGKITAMKVSDFPVNFGPEDVCTKVEKELPSVRKEIVISTESMKKFEGEYELQPGFNLKIFLENGKLFIQATGQDPFPLFPESENKFFLKVVDAQAEFIIDGVGMVNKIIFTQGSKMECKRIK